MKFILSLLGFFFLLFAIGIASLVWKVRKHVRRMRDTLQHNMDDEAFRRMSDEHNWQTKQEEGRTTRTKDGITIIDHRDPNKKIFTQDEGEYVDFREE